MDPTEKAGNESIGAAPKAVDEPGAAPSVAELSAAELSAAENAGTAPAPVVKTGGLWASALLVAMTVVIMILRESGGATASFLNERISTRPLTAGVDDHVLQLLMVPLASLVVVLCRLTLGLKMLGPFRPILIAIALQQSGVVLGIGFLIVVLAIVVAIRPRLGGGWLPYFGRLSVLLSIMAMVLAVAAILGANMDYQPLENLAMFPIVVLCLTADGFARAVDNDGLPSAGARAFTTVATALLINLTSCSWIEKTLFEYPELVFAEVALIIFVATRMQFGLLEKLNPPGKGKDEA